jgi:signal transduction histidine kinase
MGSGPPAGDSAPCRFHNATFENTFRLVVANRFSPSRGIRAMSRRLSLEIKLPLLMSVVLAVVLVASLAATITTIRRNAVDAAHERVVRGVHEIVTVGAASLDATTARYRLIANDSAVQRVLLRHTHEPLVERATTRERTVQPMRAVERALSSVTLPTDSGLPIELWSADGTRIAVVGNDIRTPPRLEAAGERELAEDIVAPAVFGDSVSDQLRFTSLYGDGERVNFWLVLPVKRTGTKETIGYIAHQRRLAIGPQTQRTLRELSGDSVSLYYRNLDGRFWTNGTRTATNPLLDRVDSVQGTARLASGESVLFREERFTTTPIVVGMYVPLRTLFARSQRTVRTLVLLSIGLLLVGMLVAWLIGRNVARPLGDLTQAAGALAAGDFRTRVPEGRDRETARLADSFNHMAAQLGASRDALERQTQEAQTANRAKSEFLTTMSHELRTPLNAIGGYVELLQMGLRGPVTDEQRRDLDRIKTSQEHLLGLISGVLDLSRIEAGRLSYTFTNVAIDPFLRGVDALVAPQAAAKNVTLEHVTGRANAAVVADREKLRQIVLNLLSNAIRHTPSGGTVTLSSEPRGQYAAIVVDDTGPGIPPDRRDVIFEPFVQLDRSLTQTREGLGLGLAISRDLARGMAGDLSVHDRPGGGARFVLVLPASRVSAEAHDSDSGEIAAVRRS